MRRTSLAESRTSGMRLSAFSAIFTAVTALDLECSARFLFSSGATGEMQTSIDHDGLQIELEIRGQRGKLFAKNPVLPHLFNELQVKLGDTETSEVVDGEPTFTGQLRAFVAWVRDGIPMPTDAWEAVENMRFIDAVYRAAGLPARGEKEERPNV